MALQFTSLCKILLDDGKVCWNMLQGRMSILMSTSSLVIIYCEKWHFYSYFISWYILLNLCLLPTWVCWDSYVLILAFLWYKLCPLECFYVVWYNVVSFIYLFIFSRRPLYLCIVVFLGDVCDIFIIIVLHCCCCCCRLFLCYCRKYI
jgi:hypothetical protein